MRCQTLLTAILLCVPIATATAQATLSTLFATNNNGAVGGAVFFDLDVANPGGIVVRGLDVNLSQAVNTTGTIEVYTCPGTRQGNQLNVANWTLVATGPVTAAGINQPSAVTLPPFSLPSGSTGIALKAVGVSHRYTNGTGGNQTWSNGEVTLSAGEATNVAFTGTLIGLRVPNLNLRYDDRLRTPFLGTNTMLNGTVLFDVDVLHPNGITITELGLNLNDFANTTGTYEVYTCPTTRIGNQANPAVWTLRGSGSMTAAGPGAVSVATPAPITLPFGSVGMAVKLYGLTHRYTASNNSVQDGNVRISGGESISALFTGMIFAPRMVNCRLQYFPGPSTATSYGSGCGAQLGSFYENFPSRAAFDLSHTAFTMTRTASGYTVASGGTFLAPGPGATVLPMQDDSDFQTPDFSIPFPVPGGSAPRLIVCSNGFVSTDANNGTNFAPYAHEHLNAPDTCWRIWGDYNPNLSGSVKFEEVGGVAIVTWDRVYNFGGTSAAAANTFQMQFELATGNVTFAFGAMSQQGGGILVGYSPGGPSGDPGSFDLSSVLGTGFPAAADERLTLRATTAPTFGRSVQFVTENLAPQTLFGAVLLGLTQYPQGLSLAPQMPGCFRYTDGAVTLPLFFGGAPTQTTTYPVPPMVGLQLYAQSVVYAPAVLQNALGAASSNGVALSIGYY